jgi:predicted metal-dependent phosphoesterase TrpH
MSPFSRRTFLLASTLSVGVAGPSSGLSRWLQPNGYAPPAMGGSEPAPAVALPHGPVVLDPYAGTTILSWWKGQLHTHTSRSFDGARRVSPARRTEIYTEHGYDFTVFTDHDRTTALLGQSGERPADHKPFLAIPGVESSHRSAHLGVWLFRHPEKAALPAPVVVERAKDPVQRMEAWAAAGALVGCNHPSHASAPLTAEQVESWAGAGAPFRFLEVFNTRANRRPGDLQHNLEVWRRAITAAGPRRAIWGVASDDSHGESDGGRAWITVAAPALHPSHLEQALLAGRFYASSGLTFSQIGVDLERAAVVATAPGATSVRFVGEDGTVRREVAGSTAAYRPVSTDRWVRAEASDGSGRSAWSQPFWIDA